MLRSRHPVQLVGLCAVLVMSSACFDSTSSESGSPDAHTVDAGPMDASVGVDGGVPEELIRALRELGEAGIASCRGCPHCPETAVQPSAEWLACVYPIVEAAGQFESLLTWFELYEEWLREVGRCYDERGCEDGRRRCYGTMQPVPPTSWSRSNRMCREVP